MSNLEKVEENSIQLDKPDVDEIDKAFELAKSKLKRKLATIETQHERLAN